MNGTGSGGIPVASGVFASQKIVIGLPTRKIKANSKKKKEKRKRKEKKIGIRG
jgi:hypothetical protein